MPDASRTLVKSPPELWTEISDEASLARHLGEFGEIRITRTQPETIVAWEGDRVRGTVELEPAGWGTKVTLTAEVQQVPAPPAPVVEPEPVAVEPTPEPEPEPGPAAPLRRSWLGRLLRRAPAAAPEPAAEVTPAPQPVEVARPEPEPEPQPGPATALPGDPQALLVGVLDTLGSAHHRPFSRG